MHVVSLLLVLYSIRIIPLLKISSDIGTLFSSDMMVTLLISDHKTGTIYTGNLCSIDMGGQVVRVVEF